MLWFYTLSELSTEWKLSENFILQMGINDYDDSRLHFHVKTDNFLDGNKLIKLNKKDIENLIYSPNDLYIKKIKNALTCNKEWVTIHRKYIVIETSEIERIEKKYPSLTRIDQLEITNSEYIIEETYEEFHERLRTNPSYNKIKIVRELITRFPSLTNQQLGRMIEPLVEVTSSGYKKRGAKWRKMAQEQQET